MLVGGRQIYFRPCKQRNSFDVGRRDMLKENEEILHQLVDDLFRCNPTIYLVGGFNHLETY